jgi:hypothetical protein
MLLFNVNDPETSFSDPPWVTVIGLFSPVQSNPLHRHGLESKFIVPADVPAQELASKWTVLVALGVAWPPLPPLDVDQCAD